MVLGFVSQYKHIAIFISLKTSKMIMQHSSDDVPLRTKPAEFNFISV